jgi:lactate permease
MMWLLRMAYLAIEPNYTNAAVIYGLFDAITPMSISGGAILLFSAMEATQCMPWIMVRLKGLSQGHPVAEVFLIMWAFEYLIEGASGFGTPVALAAPMMGQLGHSPFHAVICGLIMNTLANPVSTRPMSPYRVLHNAFSFSPCFYSPPHPPTQVSLAFVLHALN